ncbi:ArsA family ATPase [Anthocerotibacter panamensis]|uniref:ArsA family ATPase n=1 Tax=Anthocerotibacter panamensis TaxID=2857077 RepID=UPI001C403D75|nr:ArsA family ATPase [Anthocerotibacter panamensis]
MNPTIPPTVQLLLISGKGGVGKSTFACALACQLAQQERPVWLISVDPAHSIGDVLAQSVTDTPRPVAPYPHWYSLALDAQQELMHFRERYQEAVTQMASYSSLFEGADLMGLWNLGWPGFDEVMAVVRVSQILQDQQTGTVVLDMAPTGHSMRLLEYPDFIERLLQVFVGLQDKHKQLQQTFGRGYQADQADTFLTEFTERLRGLHALLSDPARTQAWVVLLAESLSVPETQRFLSFLKTAQIPVGGVVVNQVVRAVVGCSFCEAWAASQQARLAELPAVALWQVPLFLEEPIGEAALSKVFACCTPLVSEPLAMPASPYPDPTQPGLPDYLALGQRLVLLAGKGGVGKTTTAAALAVRIAREHPDTKILIVSIDPAHSLGDAFAQPLGPKPICLRENLWGQEVAAAATLTEVMAGLREALANLNRDDMSLEEARTWQALLEQPPPGLDEIAALLNVVEVSDQWGLIILDTAPTGHLLRLLQMPQVLEEWLTYFLRLWVKYRNMFADTTLVEQFRQWRKQVLQLQKDLTNPQYTVALPVLNAETTVLQETIRLVAALTSLQLAPAHLVINRIVQSKSCTQCQAIATHHERILRRIQASFPGQTLLSVPLLPTLPAGIPGLAVYGTYL